MFGCCMLVTLLFLSIGGIVRGRVAVGEVGKWLGVWVGMGIVLPQSRYGMSFQSLKCHLVLVVCRRCY